MKLLTNLGFGFRLVTFLPVRNATLHPSFSLCFVAISISVVICGVASYSVQSGEIVFNEYALGTVSAIILAFVVIALLHMRVQQDFESLPRLLTVWAFTSPYVVTVIVLASRLLDQFVTHLSAWIALLIWLVVIAARASRYVFLLPHPKAAFLVSGSLFALLVASWHLPLSPTMFYSYDPVEWEQYADIDIEGVYVSQAELIEDAWKTIAPETPERSDMYFVGFAGDGDESVFEKEAEFAATAVSTVFDITNRSLVLSNNIDRIDTHALANSYNLYQTIEHVGQKLNATDDVLFLFLTSHGSSDATVSVALYPFSLKPVSAPDLKEALDASGIQWRIIVVSACYSGSFIEPLKDDHTLIITAAAEDKTSFGCSDMRELTYFGEAFLRDSLAKGIPLLDAYDNTVTLIEEREAAERISSSMPQMYVGEAMSEKLLQLASQTRQ